MKKYLKYIAAVVTSTLVLSCDNYVDIQTEGKLVPEETLNYRYLLNNSRTYDNTYDLLDVASDDVDFKNELQITTLEASTFYSSFINAYKWSDQVFPDGERDYPMEGMYEALYYTNVIITEVMNSKKGTEAEKLAIKGEAQVHRAFIYLMLVNSFGKAYDATTSVTDLGVPIFTTPTVSQDITRATVQEVYNLILSDLNDAVNSGLKPVNSGLNLAFPSKASAYALLARTYLLMRNYPEAKANAEHALALQNRLTNLADFENGTYPTKRFDPEIILSKSSFNTLQYSPMLLGLSDELINSFDTNDLRYVMFTKPIADFDFSLTEGRVYAKETLTFEGRNAGPTVPEMMLIKAECDARAGSAALAMQTINKLRESRFRTGENVILTATDNNDALLKVLAERRRELMGLGCFRWFDLKRLNKEPQFAKTISHSFKGQTLTLAPNSDRYQLPYAPILFQYAPNLQQNP